MAIKVLSLFDGMSCGQIALDQLGIEVDTYYASEIDKYAIEITQKNFPKTIQVGDITKLDPKDFADVDLIMGGSPCQGFSFAGKQLAFDDPRSALFFEFIRMLKAIKPKYFLLENVRMKKEFLDIISQQVSECYPEITFGIQPILINSSSVSAQSRQRYYWTNISNIKQPEERGIVLRDILETKPETFTAMSDKFVKRNGDRDCMIDLNKEKASNLSAMEYVKNGRQGDYLACDSSGKPKQVGNLEDIKGHDILKRVYSEDGKSPTITAHAGKGTVPKIETKPKQVGKLIEQVKVRKHEVDIPKLQTCILDHYAKCGKNKKEIAKELNDKYSTVEHYFRKLGSNFFCIPSEEHWPQLKKILGIETNKFDKQIMEFEFRDGVFETKQRVYSDEGKSPTLTHGSADKLIQVGVAADINGHDILKRVYSPEGKSPTLNACGGGNTEPKVITGGAFRGRAYDKDGKRMDRDGSSVANKTKQMLELRKDDKSNAITTVGKDSVVVDEELTWRKLTPLECERLQTVPDNYTEGVSNTQRYKMLGNGWTVEVIKHILGDIK